jgi:hypothetical protein
MRTNLRIQAGPGSGVAGVNGLAAERGRSGAVTLAPAARPLLQRGGVSGASSRRADQLPRGCVVPPVPCVGQQELG